MLLDLPCVIFAGGKSSRMGEDKSLLPFSNFPTLTQFQLDKLQKIFKTVYISTKDRSKFDFSANFIEDIDIFATSAPTIAFLSVFDKLKCERFFAISVDTPFISKDTIVELLKADDNSHFATIAKSKNTLEPLCGIYHISLRDLFLDMIKNDNHKLNHMLKNIDITMVEVPNEIEFFNLNYPHEYKKALELLNI